MTNNKKTGYVGTLWGVPVKIDPDAPKGQLFFMNDKYIEVARIDARSRWQRIKDWFKGLVK